MRHAIFLPIQSNFPRLFSAAYLRRLDIDAHYLVGQPVTRMGSQVSDSDLMLKLPIVMTFLPPDFRS
jgi:hypothetical protein